MDGWALTVKMKYMRALSLDAIEFRADSSGEAARLGGIYTAGDTICYDPQFLVGANERVLSFCLAHELGHRWFSSARGRILADNQAIPGEELLLDLEESFADAYAISKLYESGWHKEEMARCLNDWKSHMGSYLAAHACGVMDLTLLDDVQTMALRQVERIWQEFSSGLRRHSVGPYLVGFG